ACEVLFVFDDENQVGHGNSFATTFEAGQLRWEATMDMIWELEGGPLRTESVARVLVEEIEATPGFEPRRYDMNQRGVYRDYDRDHLVVDTLTQRTQIVRIESSTPGELAVVATGKHGEQPVMMMKWSPTHDDPLQVTARWDEVFERLPLGRALLSSPGWQSGAGPSLGLPGFAFGYPHSRIADSALEEFEDLAHASMIRLDRYPSYMRVILSPTAELIAVGEVVQKI
ncbi:MAG: hypothetical protein ACNA8W_19205, partial [Bradymonadaceae bacterium]